MSYYFIQRRPTQQQFSFNFINGIIIDQFTQRGCGNHRTHLSTNLRRNSAKISIKKHPFVNSLHHCTTSSRHVTIPYHIPIPLCLKRKIKTIQRRAYAETPHLFVTIREPISLTGRGGLLFLFFDGHPLSLFRNLLGPSLCLLIAVLIFTYSVIHM